MRLVNSLTLESKRHLRIGWIPTEATTTSAQVLLFAAACPAWHFVVAARQRLLSTCHRVVLVCCQRAEVSADVFVTAVALSLVGDSMPRRRHVVLIVVVVIVLLLFLLLLSFLLLSCQVIIDLIVVSLLLIVPVSFSRFLSECYCCSIAYFLLAKYIHRSPVFSLLATV